MWLKLTLVRDDSKIILNVDHIVTVIKQNGETQLHLRDEEWYVVKESIDEIEHLIASGGIRLVTREPFNLQSVY